jgi:phosphomannomutase/phosphoglucomutase
LYGNEIQEIKKIMMGFAEQGSTLVAKIKGVLQNIDIFPHYTDTILKNFEGTLPAEGLDKPIKIVVDAGNGTGGLVAPDVLRKLGCEVVELYCAPNGKFPNHHPDPTVAENLKDLIREVKAEGADFGVGYDGDADRIGIVDENGKIVWGDQIMVIFARAILEKKQGETIVGEVKCSQTMYDEIEKCGGKGVMWKTGHSLIKARMKELGAAMAGEMSGHIFFADRYFGFDDAIYATCRLVEILAEKRQKDSAFGFSALLADLPETFTTPEIRVECPEQEKFEIIDALKKVIKEGVAGPAIKKIIDIDGIRVVFENGWGLVRASNTQPVLVMRYEATSEALLEEYKGFMKTALQSAWPSITVQV